MNEWMAFSQFVVSNAVIMYSTLGFVDWDGMSRCLTLLFLMLHATFVILCVPQWWLPVVTVWHLCDGNYLVYYMNDVVCCVCWHYYEAYEAINNCIVCHMIVINLYLPICDRTMDCVSTFNWVEYFQVFCFIVVQKYVATYKNNLQLLKYVGQFWVLLTCLCVKLANRIVLNACIRDAEVFHLFVLRAFVRFWLMKWWKYWILTINSVLRL